MLQWLDPHSDGNAQEPGPIHHDRWLRVNNHPGISMPNSKRISPGGPVKATAAIASGAVAAAKTNVVDATNTLTPEAMAGACAAGAAGLVVGAGLAVGVSQGLSFASQPGCCAVS